MQPEKIDLTSTSISEEKLAQLRDLLPEVFHEGAINWDELRNALGDYVEDDPKNERFGLRWPGKSQLQQVINTPSVGTLVPMPEESVDWDETGNVIIEGDNLEVLKLLQKSYAGKVKMIYIDPPYNTGNDFVYPDKYASGIDTYLEFTGQKDEQGNKLSSNSEASGRYHANWLNMMYPRLYLARNLLRQDGVIFISIDDSEVANLIKMAEGIFGDANFIASFIWKSKSGGANDSGKIAVDHEYIVAFCKDADTFIVQLDKRASASTNYGHTDEVGRYSLERLDKQNLQYSASLDYVIAGPDGLEYRLKHKDSLRPNAIWRWSRDRVAKEMDQLVFRDGNVYTRNYEKAGLIPRSLLTEERFGRTRTGSAEVEELMGPGLFNAPKTLRLISHLVQIGSCKDDIILDFFAGSGTTGHAVMQQNAEDGGNRKYILVQLPEPMESKTLDDGTQLHTIADICRERVRRAGKKIAAELKSAAPKNGPATPGDLDARSQDLGFRAHKLAPSNFKPWDGSNAPMLTSARQASFMPQTQQLTLEERLLQAADHLDPNASDTAVLTELLLKLGEELTVPVKMLTLAGKTVFDVDTNLRLICLERDINLHVIREMAALEPAEILCLDAGFPDDQTKVNAAQIIATQASHGEESIAFKVV